MKAKMRSVIRLDKALVITLPAEFVREHQIKAGDKVAVMSNDWLQVMPHRLIKRKKEG